jgi:hypothetical protein
MALAGRSASVGVRDRVRTRNASCTPRLVHVSADGVLAAQLLTCNRAICPFLPFRALRCAAQKWPVYRDFAMARPGLEPGTPRFSGSRGGAIPLAKDLQIRGSKSDAVWCDGVGSGRFRGGLGLRRALEVPMSPAAPVTGWTRPPVCCRSRRPPRDATPTARVEDERPGTRPQANKERRAGVVRRSGPRPPTSIAVARVIALRGPTEHREHEHPTDQAHPADPI